MSEFKITHKVNEAFRLNKNARLTSVRLILGKDELPKQGIYTFKLVLTDLIHTSNAASLIAGCGFPERHHVYVVAEDGLELQVEVPLNDRTHPGGVTKLDIDATVEITADER